jgi:hypothetical protein
MLLKCFYLHGMEIQSGPVFVLVLLKKVNPGGQRCRSYKLAGRKFVGFIGLLVTDCLKNDISHIVF